MLHDSIKLANKVRAAMNSIGMPTQVARTSTFQAYENEREQGYCLVVHGKQTYISFARFRRSDEIVVYVSHQKKEGNVPTEDAYQERKLFGPKAFRTAARHIIAQAKKAAR